MLIPLRPVSTTQRAKSLAVAIFAEALTASPNALRRSSMRGCVGSQFSTLGGSEQRILVKIADQNTAQNDF